MAKEKAPVPRREELVVQLEDVARYMEILGENDFKVRAFRKGAGALAASDAALADVAAGSTKVAGVGEGLRAAVGEFLGSGRVAALDDLAARIPAGVLELMKIPGLGPKKAMLIQKELGVGSIGELEYACRENRLTALKGFGEAAQKKILEGIEQLNANAGKFRLDEAFARSAELELELRALLGRRAELERVGALGRGAEIVETLEYRLTGAVAAVLESLKTLAWDEKPKEAREKPFETELTNVSGRLSGGLAVTFWVGKSHPGRMEGLWLCAHERVRAEIAAKPKGYEGYEAAWLEPEWLEAGRAPSTDTYRRARDGHVRGIFHCHTDFSDGSATLEQMVHAAEERGYEYIGIADHSQSAAYAQGLKPARIKEQRKKIEELQRTTSIRIFHGIESDILADGELDYDEGTLETLDFVVGSIHSRFKMDDAEMTRRISRALSNPHLTMWGHPTGRLLLGRKGYGLDWAAVLDAAAAGGAGLELNANPHRLDFDWRLGAEIERRGTPVFVNPDAHAVEGLDDTRFGELMAEKAMIRRGQIVNLMGAAEMEKYLWDRKRRRKKI